MTENVFIENAKRLLSWNQEKLTHQAHLTIEDIEQLFAPKFVVIANGREYQANSKLYLDFLNQFRSNIDKIDYQVQEYLVMDSTVVMPLMAEVTRLHGKVDRFHAIMLIKFDTKGKIVHWQEVYVVS